jgi:membrane-associated phospholipid phosphatase
VSFDEPGLVAGVPIRPVTVNRRPALLALAGTAVVLLTLVYLFGVRTTWGQRLNATSLEGRSALRPRTVHAASQLLDTISVSSLVLIGGLIVLIALARRRPLLSLAAGAVIGGSVVTTELLKKVILTRPDLGIVDPLGLKASFPSGHTTVAFSLAIAATLVAPSRHRGLVAVVGALYAIGIGVGVVATANHRPCDPIGAVMVVTAWSATLAALLQSVSVDTPRDIRNRRVSPALALGAAALLAFAFIGLAGTSLAIRADRLGTVELSGAFAGACAAITGTVLIAVAALLWCLRGVTLDPPFDEIVELQSEPVAE